MFTDCILVHLQYLFIGVKTVVANVGTRSRLFRCNTGGFRCGLDITASRFGRLSIGLAFKFLLKRREVTMSYLRKRYRCVRPPSTRIFTKRTLNNDVVEYLRILSPLTLFPNSLRWRTQRDERWLSHFGSSDKPQRVHQILHCFHRLKYFALLVPAR